ncbi:hypothetical protein CcNV_080 [Crangon crangon nudivirus]|uniref:Uncharacterized protein n=1 Tax=Crangon crangon nudivirus TaxID=2880838 RepID=A0AAE8Y094_9VIRU|nr:hypothetical protein QKT25_gp081 [Crangon crangon nudivirus]UBZ25565.1 hypothetical protein CcNV_080 [Crangon crangon nudivirus]
MQRNVRIEQSGRFKDFKDSLHYYDKQLPTNYNNIRHVIEYIVCKTHYLAIQYTVNFRNGICNVVQIDAFTNNKNLTIVRINTNKCCRTRIQPIKTFLRSLKEHSIVITKPIPSDKYVDQVVDIYRATAYDATFPDTLKNAALHLDATAPTRVNQSNYSEKAKSIIDSLGMDIDLAHVYITLIKQPAVTLTELDSNLASISATQKYWGMYYTLYIFTQKINYKLHI